MNNLQTKRTGYGRTKGSESRQSNLEFVQRIGRFREIHVKNINNTLIDLSKQTHNIQITIEHNKRMLEVTQELMTKMRALIDFALVKWNDLVALYNLLYEPKGVNQLLTNNKEFQDSLNNQFHLLVQSKATLELYARKQIEELKIMKIKKSLSISECICH